MSRTTNTLIINKLALAASVDTSPGLTLQPNPGTGEYIELSVTTSRWVGELVQTPIEPSEFPIGPTTITQIDDLSDSTDISMGQLVEVRQEPSLQVTNLAEVGNLIISTPAPVDPIGEFGDVVGMMRAGDDGIYYCSADFNGVDEIWKFARFVPSPIGWDDITDKQGKVLDDLTLIEDVADINTTFAGRGYIVKEDDLNGFWAGATMLVSENGGVVSQLISAPLVGKIGMRRYEAGVWGEFSFTIAPFDVQQWYSNSTTEAANAVINSDGTFSRSLASHNPNPLLEVSGASHAFVKADVNKYARYTSTGAKTATFDSSEGFTADDEFHITNRAASDNITISGTGVTFNPPKNGTLVLEPKDTVTVKFISNTEADVMGSTEAA